MRSNLVHKEIRDLVRGGWEGVVQKISEILGCSRAESHGGKSISAGSGGTIS